MVTCCDPKHLLTLGPAAKKRDTDHELTKSHLAHLHATEAQARQEGGYTWAAHDMMTEEVEKYIEAYKLDERRASYETDKMWIEKLMRSKKMFHEAGEKKWREWCHFLEQTQEQISRYEERYGEGGAGWEWLEKC